MHPESRPRGRQISAIGAAFGLALAGRALAQTLSLNLPGALAGTKAKLSAGEVAGIVVIGDSLSFRAGTWLPFFRASIQAQYGDAGPGYQGFSLWTGAAFNTGWTQGQINQDTVPHHSLDGLWAASSSGPGGQTPTDAVFYANAPTIITHLMGIPGGGSVRAAYPDGSSAILSTNAASNTVLAVTGHVAGAGSAVSYQPQGDGPVTILGQNNLSGLPGVVIHRAANGGWGVDSFLGRDWTFDRQLSLLDPSLVMVWLGQNDQGKSRATFGALVSLLVDRVSVDAPGAGIILIGTFDVGKPGIPDLVGGMEDVAQARGLGFINLYSAGGPWLFLLQNGYLEGSHFSPAGGEYFAGLMQDAFTNETVAPFCGAHIDVQPLDVTVNPGDQVEVHVGAAATVGMNFQWMHDDTPVTDDARISGAQSDTLTISPAVRGDSGSYRVVVTTACGSVDSAAAWVQVTVPCPADYNLDGFLDPLDYNAFINDFETGSLAADYNGDGFLDPLDYNGFINDFEAGC